MFVATLILSLLLAAACLWLGRATLGRDARSEEMRRGLGVEEPLWVLIGVLQVLAAVGLVVGLAVPMVGVVSALGLGVLGIGAVLGRFRVGDGADHLTGPALLGLLAAATVAVRSVSA